MIDQSLNRVVPFFQENIVSLYLCCFSILKSCFLLGLTRVIPFAWEPLSLPVVASVHLIMLLARFVKFCIFLKASASIHIYAFYIFQTPVGVLSHFSSVTDLENCYWFLLSPSSFPSVNSLEVLIFLPVRSFVHFPYNLHGWCPAVCLLFAKFHGFA